ncbi:hypothetical protein Clacol_007739 [Clathrus columnatus]|uniref:Threonine/serine exporter-like N-terminal domain-containing protein n=1 Tax=Clathrus columnatus TaxID=1419009 RepID=A0AAV5AGK7_9AGAM|nr:hypothetical protein Clacol_007739 [Clathrus columnatus]
MKHQAHQATGQSSSQEEKDREVEELDALDTPRQGSFESTEQSYLDITDPIEKDRSSRPIVSVPHTPRASPVKTPPKPEDDRTPADVLPIPAQSTSNAPKRVQWAPKNQIEHFERVPLEEESEEEWKDIVGRLRELDEHGADPAPLARLQRALEAYVHPSGHRRARNRGADEPQLPIHIAQSKPAPRSKNTRRLINRSGSGVNSPISQTQERSHAEASRQHLSMYRDLQGKGKRISGLESDREDDRETLTDLELDSSADTQHNLPQQRRRLFETHYDLGHSQLSSIPEAKPGMPPSFRIKEWARKAQEQGYGQLSEKWMEDGMVGEQGEQDKRWWEDRAKGLVRKYSTRRRPSIPEASVSPHENLQPNTKKSEAELIHDNPPSHPDDVDLEKGQPSASLIEPLPLGRQNGVLGTLLTLYGNPAFNDTTSSLGSTTTGDESTGTTDMENISDGDESGEEEEGNSPAESNTKEDVADGGNEQETEKPIRGRGQSLLKPIIEQVKKEPARTRRQTGLQPIVDRAEASEEPGRDRSQSLQPIIDQVKKEPARTRRQTGLQPIVNRAVGLEESARDRSQTLQPTIDQVKKQPARTRRQTGLQPIVDRVAEEPARSRRLTGLPPVADQATDKPVRGRRLTGLPRVDTLEHPPQRDEESPFDEDEMPSREAMSPYGRLKQTLSAPSSTLRLPFSGHVPLPLPRIPPSIAQLTPAVTSTPKPSRSSGGVIAALITTSNNLAGAATPTANTIAPDLSRQGYTLSRLFEIEFARLTPSYRYEFSTSQRPPTARTASEDPRLQAPLYPDFSAEERLEGSPSADEREQVSSREEINETDATDATLISPTPNAERSLVEHPPRPSLQKMKHSSFVNWLPHVLSRSGSRTPSVAGDRERADSLSGYTSSQISLSGTDQEVLAHKIEKRLHKHAKKERKRRQAQIYITRHIAEVMQRQEFIMKFARAHMMFAGPGHRLQSQLQVTARVLDLQISTVHLPNVLWLSFDDESTSTSNVKFIQQSSSLDLEKLSVMHELFWKVIHDELSVSSASAALDLLMCSPQRYRRGELILFGGLASSAICTLSFSGSFADALISFPLGCLLVITQIFSSRNELYSNVFEITIATVLSFLSAALASSGKFCYAALASSSVVLILPGFFVLSGSLELASKQIVSGAGFGIAIGAQFFTRITHLQIVGPDDSLCNAAHEPGASWWDRKPSLWWAFLTVPLYSLALSLRNQGPIWRREMPVLLSLIALQLVTLLISCGGWAANHWAGVAFHGRPDIQSAIGAFAVGVTANLYARFFYGNAYVVMITGILFQLPSGLANGGLLKFAAADNSANGGPNFSSYQAGFQVAIQLIVVAIGLTVGLFTSVVVVHPLGGSKRRMGALFSL